MRGPVFDEDFTRNRLMQGGDCVCDRGLIDSRSMRLPAMDVRDDSGRADLSTALLRRRLRAASVERTISSTGKGERFARVARITHPSR